MVAAFIPAFVGQVVLLGVGATAVAALVIRGITRIRWIWGSHQEDPGLPELSGTRVRPPRPWRRT